MDKTNPKSKVWIPFQFFGNFSPPNKSESKQVFSTKTLLRLELAERKAKERKMGGKFEENALFSKLRFLISSLNKTRGGEKNLIFLSFPRVPNTIFTNSNRALFGCPENVGFDFWEETWILKLYNLTITGTQYNTTKVHWIQPNSTLWLTWRG